MDIVATALAFERKGASVYEDLSRRSEQPLAKELFGMLAEDERKHERYFQWLAEGRGLPTETVQASSGLGGQGQRGLRPAGHIRPSCREEDRRFTGGLGIGARQL